MAPNMYWDDDIQLVLERTASQKDINDEYERPEEDWKPCRQEYLIMISLSLISLMVALDSSILIPALPVSRFALGFTPQTSSPFVTWRIQKKKGITLDTHTSRDLKPWA